LLTVDARLDRQSGEQVVATDLEPSLDGPPGESPQDAPAVRSAHVFRILETLWGCLARPRPTLQTGHARIAAVALVAFLTALHGLLGFLATPKAREHALLALASTQQNATPVNVLEALILASVTTLVSETLAPMMLWTLRSLALFAAGALLCRSFRFREAFVLAVLADTPMLLVRILRTCAVLASPAQLFGQLQKSPLVAIGGLVSGQPWPAMLALLDPFSLWGMSLACLAASEFLGRPTRTIALVLVPSWLSVTALGMLLVR
jgi:hypothetical protein